MQADDKARVEAEAREKADAAKAALDALKEAQAESLKGAEEATAVYDESVMSKHVRHPLLMSAFQWRHSLLAGVLTLLIRYMPRTCSMDPGPCVLMSSCAACMCVTCS